MSVSWDATTYGASSKGKRKKKSYLGHALHDLKEVLGNLTWRQSACNHFKHLQRGHRRLCIGKQLMKVEEK